MSELRHLHLERATNWNVFGRTVSESAFLCHSKTTLLTSAHSQVFGTVRAAFRSEKTLDIRFRKQQLLALERFLRDESQMLLDALHADLHKVSMPIRASAHRFYSYLVHLRRRCGRNLPRTSGNRLPLEQHRFVGRSQGGRRQRRRVRF